MGIRLRKIVGQRLSSAAPKGALMVPLAMLLALSTQHLFAQSPGGTGNQGDIRINGDFDGDGILDSAIWNPNSGIWYIYGSHTGNLIREPFGLLGDVPVPGDYFGDGQTSYAVWRPSNGTWYVMSSKTGTVKTQQLGQSGDIPVPADYDGDGITDMAVWRPSNGTWYILLSKTNSMMTKQFGQTGDAPFTGDFDGDGKSELVFYRYSDQNFYAAPSRTNWSTVFTPPQSAGHSAADIPFVGDFDGDGVMDYAVWRPYDPDVAGYSAPGIDWHPGAELHIVFSRDLSTAMYQSVPPSQLFSTQFKVPGFDNTYSGAGTATRVYNLIEGDFDGDGQPDFALFDQQNGSWYVVPSTNPASPLQVPWCNTSGGDIPVAADYFGNGQTDFACWRPSNGNWYITSTSNANGRSLNTNTYILQFGLPGADQPEVGDYDGDGKADLAVWRPSLGSWFINPIATALTTGYNYTVQWGLPGDIPVAADHHVAGIGITDLVVYRPSLGTWYISGVPGQPQQFGLPVGDQPMVGDFDHDGKADFMIWRPTLGTAYGLSSTGASEVVQLGVTGSSLILNQPPTTPSLGPK